MSVIILQSQQDFRTVDELTRKIEDLIRRLSLLETKDILDQARNSNEKKPLPSLSYCRNFLEAFPNIHDWTLQYRGSNRSEILSKVENAGDDKVLKLESELELVYYDLCNASYSIAFDKVNSLAVDDLDPSLPNVSSLLSTVAELRGTESFL